MSWAFDDADASASHVIINNHVIPTDQIKEANLTNLEEVILAGSPKESKVKTEITDNGERETSVIVKKG